MENQKIINLLDKDDTNSKHLDTGADNPDTINYDTRVLKPILCDYAEAYILVDGTIRAANAVNNTRLKIVHHLLNTT